MLNHTFLACLLGMSPVSCSYAQQQRAKELRLPDALIALTALEDRAAYLSLYYWDHFDSAGTSLISCPEITKQAFVDPLGILPYTDRTQAIIDTFFRRATTRQEMLHHFIGLSGKYLYESNSPMHGEELYILVLRALLDNPYPSDTDKVHPRYLLEIAIKNRPGDVAADFTVTCRNDRRRQLSGIRTDYALICFNDPDCEDCHRVKELLTLSPAMNDLLESGHLKLLSACVKGKTPAWEKVEFPAGWIGGYDANQRLIRKQVCNPKAMPTLYLLDAEKRVMLKDASFEQVEKQLS